jgi:hypothetical protein
MLFCMKVKGFFVDSVRDLGREGFGKRFGFT